MRFSGALFFLRGYSALGSNWLIGPKGLFNKESKNEDISIEAGPAPDLKERMERVQEIYAEAYGNLGIEWELFKNRYPDEPRPPHLVWDPMDYKHVHDYVKFEEMVDDHSFGTDFYRIEAIYKNTWPWVLEFRRKENEMARKYGPIKPRTSR